jgi:hypothetical protein
MKKKELIALLDKFSDDQEVFILDGFNGGGYPRTINFGPILYKVSLEDVEESSDCNHMEGAKIILLGYGSY